VKNAEKREHKKETENGKRESKKKNSKIKRRKTQVTGEQRGFFL
jgi:hypothetical protein